MPVLSNTTIRLTQPTGRSQSASTTREVPATARRSRSLRSHASTSRRVSPAICVSSPVFRTEYPDFSTLEPLPAVPRSTKLGEPSNSGSQFSKDDLYSQSSLLSLLSQSVIARSDLLNFESLAGRLAMISFTLAVGIELTQGHSVFTTEDGPLLFLSAGGIAASVLALLAGSDAIREGLLSSTQFLLPPEDSLTETMLEVVLEDISLDGMEF
mmetsp:Transcript_9453/g.10956  ORF Transcript_9453/g.10956 Transcript_9453/m.10956 type:complete len:212 (+) Transcript_9453:164-799(+)|eukprot:CAMPEP_0197850210 /NCGR_PEP_ID=MMETSP1438-20131217/14625_1 /TAXON_ID=1461541 /ORGANISM="Pterosperma sp., Strain CCMP1384" /LENGTH=211 /DNA_ID=CAMNT_0043463247 /DNA_START=152 /DNA_END=787 /DNA_ORIENTATION=+